MIFATSNDAFWRGVSDSYHQLTDTVVENHHWAYERGFVMGWMIRRDEAEHKVMQQPVTTSAS